MKVAQEKVDKFAKEVGYEYAKYRIEWGGYSCYELCFSDMEGLEIGWPQFVLVDNKGRMRVARDEKKGDEVEQIYDEILNSIL